MACASALSRNGTGPAVEHGEEQRGGWNEDVAGGGEGALVDERLEPRRDAQGGLEEAAQRGGLDAAAVRRAQAIEEHGARRGGVGDAQHAERGGDALPIRRSRHRAAAHVLDEGRRCRRVRGGDRVHAAECGQERGEAARRRGGGFHQRGHAAQAQPPQGVENAAQRAELRTR